MKADIEDYENSTHEEFNSNFEKQAKQEEDKLNAILEKCQRKASPLFQKTSERYPQIDAKALKKLSNFSFSQRKVKNEKYGRNSSVLGKNDGVERYRSMKFKVNHFTQSSKTF